VSLAIGLRGEATLIVSERETAAALGAGGVHVLATPMMINLMENAAWRAVQSQLAEGDTTVGMVVNVRHLAATPVGGHVTATAELVEIDGRRLVFQVSAHDDSGLIGDGTHERVIVHLARFLERVSKR